MTEYIVIVALVGVAAIGVYSFLGGSVRGATAGIALEISGQNAQRGITAAQNAANNAVTNAARRTTLGNYNEGNR
ncbi:MAG: pilus assembly protein [Lautropia sp.]|nr:pilus assembly protein [Lautropia sp.]